MRYVAGTSLPSHPYLGSLPAEQVGSLAWHQDPVLHLSVVTVALLVMLVTVFGWLVGLRYRPGRDLPAPPAQARLARLAAGGAVTALVVALAGAAVVASLSPPLLDQAVQVGGSALLAGPRMLFSLGAVGTVATAAYAGIAWRHRWWTVAHRVHFSAVAVALTAFLAVANHYHLLDSPLGAGWPAGTCA